MKKFIIILVVVFCSGSMLAQQEVMVSQYMFNGLLINPAYAGSHEYFSASALHRSQWVQFDGAPTTQVFAVDGPIANNKLGLGFIVSNDQLGITKQFDVGANLSYKLRLGSGSLNFGLKASMGTYSAALSDAVIWDSNDQVYLQNDIQGALVTQLGFGVYYHTDLFYAGISIPTIYSLDDNILETSSTVDNYFTQHYYLNAGAVLNKNSSLAFKPSFLVKYLPGAPVEVDLNLNVLLYERLWLGAGYRTGDAIIGMIEYNIGSQLRLGYAYDFTTTDISNYSSGSHEIMLGYDFGKSIDVKTRSPRYF